MKKVMFASLGVLLLLAATGCGSGRIGGNAREYKLADKNSNLSGDAGERPASQPPTTAEQKGDVMISSPSQSPSMAVDATMQFTAATKDSGGSAVQWASSLPGVATIDENGLATGTGAGTTEITATKNGKTSVPFLLTLCDYRHT
jgi:hypothetical protein